MFLAQGQLSEFVILRKIILENSGHLIRNQKWKKKIQSQLLQLEGTSLKKLAEAAARGPLEMGRRVCTQLLGKFSQEGFYITFLF